MMSYIHRRNFQNDDVPIDTLGPFDFVQITYNEVIRVGPDNGGDRQIARFRDSMWKFDDGTEWTDLTITDGPG